MKSVSRMFGGLESLTDDQLMYQYKLLQQRILGLRGIFEKRAVEAEIERRGLRLIVYSQVTGSNHGGAPGGE